MNADHADAVEIYAHAFAGGAGLRGSLTGIDVEGVDVANGDDVRRVFFPAPLDEAAMLRRRMGPRSRNGVAQSCGLTLR